MSSVIYFKLKSAAAGQVEPVHFTGQQMTLLDLKKAIVKLKKMSSAMDFDLKITDADDKSKGYFIYMILIIFYNKFVIV